MDQPADRLEPGDAGADEDRRDHEQPGEPLGALGSQDEGDRRAGSAVSASPKLWIRSASSATLLVSKKIAV